MKRKRWHIEYIVHVYVDAEDRDEALDRGSYHLHMLETAGTLSDHCELLAEEMEDEDDTMTSLQYWDKDENGDYTCFDCENPVSPNDVYGNRKNVPRCEDCHHKNK